MRAKGSLKFLSFQPYAFRRLPFAIYFEAKYYQSSKQ